MARNQPPSSEDVRNVLGIVGSEATSAMLEGAEESVRQAAYDGTIQAVKDNWLWLPAAAAVFYATLYALLEFTLKDTVREVMDENRPK